MKAKKILSVAMCMAMASSLLAACGGGNAGTGTADGGAASDGGDAAASGKILKSISDIDVASLKGTSITLYTHGVNRVLGEEKKDENGNTYRDESYAYLKHLAEKFETEYGVHVDLQVNSTEDDSVPCSRRQTPLSTSTHLPTSALRSGSSMQSPTALSQRLRSFTATTLIPCTTTVHISTLSCPLRPTTTL